MQDFFYIVQKKDRLKDDLFFKLPDLDSNQD